MALPLLDRALGVCVRVLGGQHARVASVLNDMGVAHLQMGDLELALRCFEQSLQVLCFSSWISHRI